MSDESKVKMGAEGQITIPKWVRDRLGLNGGESFFVEEDGKDILLRRLKKLRRIEAEEAKKGEFIWARYLDSLPYADR